MDVVRSQKLPRKFGGDKEHLYVEAWQLLGQFAGLPAEIESAEPIEVDGVKGAKARAVLKDLDGRVMGGAIAYCMRDEGNWRNKPWFQLARMAQTRAVSKAYRNRLAWIAVLAGYSGTPAEEMDGVQPAVEATGQAKSLKGRGKPPMRSLDERRAKAVELAGPLGYSQEDLETWRPFARNSRRSEWQGGPLQMKISGTVV